MTVKPDDIESAEDETARTHEPVVTLYDAHLRERSPDDLDARVFQRAQHALERDNTPRLDGRRWRVAATLAAGFLLGAFAMYVWFAVVSTDDIEIAEDPQPGPSVQRSNPLPTPGADSVIGVPKDR